MCKSQSMLLGLQAGQPIAGYSALYGTGLNSLDQQILEEKHRDHSRNQAQNLATFSATEVNRAYSVDVSLWLRKADWLMECMASYPGFGFRVQHFHLRCQGR